ncbi:hypothetical protein B7494_g1806 [Chlorociboria aeruginascens]|nr:hypothetical protein B7494_g1806 [Chlorociboria aeruginascens]
MDKGGELGGPSANSSSDFVRKLYKMLEDPAYESIVRWGKGGESFVVLENEKFTKSILPKHFKHSNFASFVRQLNKYDFHKVRQSNEDNTPSPYGPNAWEFKHPEFQANKKDNLDNIRRKAPAPRKTAQSSDDQYSNQQADLVNSQLMATQQQLQHLSERYQDLAQGHMVLLQQVIASQKLIKNHDLAMKRVMPYLLSVDAQRRNNRIGGQFPNGMVGEMPNDGVIDDHPASPLQQASQLLQELSAESLPTEELEQMTHDYSMRNDYSTPPNELGTSSIMNHAAANSLAFPLGNDMDNMVYPVGQTQGIDPINSEHINNIPYALPLPMNAVPDMVPQSVPQTVPQSVPQTEAVGTVGNRKKNSTTVEAVWGPNKPRILLVEDDKVCARIGSKFLQLFECGVEIACDGLEAVEKITHGTTHFDLILMDIIMPNLDGVSATDCIRQVQPNIPIIAMTSNIRADDIDMYFRYGMNAVLPKPFTKEGMLRALEKHLSRFKQQTPYPNTAPMPHPGGFVTPNQPPLGLNMGQLSSTQSIKEESSPGKSPATASSWHSPSQLPGTSPVVSNPSGSSYMQPMRDSGPYSMAPSLPHPPGGYPAPNPPLGASRAGPHRRVLSDMTGGSVLEEHVDKRQRMYPSNQGNFSQ